MSGLISNTELTLELEQRLPSCNNLVIISAFMTQPATLWLSQLISVNQPNVILVGRFTPNDFVKGASDIDALRDCINSGFKVKALVNLHAKIYQIDSDTIFNGSANLTGKGLALVNNGNLESCNKVNACNESKAFISKIVESSTELTLNIINKMQEYLKQFEDQAESEIPALWPNDIMPVSTDLFVSDFPLCKPDEAVAEYKLNPSLPFAQIEQAKSNFSLAAKLFKQSKAYCWLKTQVTENKSERDLGFGQISRLLHDALADDPAPYRQEIKDLQANLLSYLKLYASDEIEVYVPGRRSEILRIKKD